MYPTRCLVGNKKKNEPHSVCAVFLVGFSTWCWSQGPVVHFSFCCHRCRIELVLQQGNNVVTRRADKNCGRINTASPFWMQQYLTTPRIVRSILQTTFHSIHFGIHLAAATSSVADEATVASTATTGTGKSSTLEYHGQSRTGVDEIGPISLVLNRLTQTCGVRHKDV